MKQKRKTCILSRPECALFRKCAFCRGRSAHQEGPRNAEKSKEKKAETQKTNIYIYTIKKEKKDGTLDLARISTLAASTVAAERLETESVHFVEARVRTFPKVCPGLDKMHTYKTTLRVIRRFGGGETGVGRSDGGVGGAGDGDGGGGVGDRGGGGGGGGGGDGEW